MSTRGIRVYRRHDVAELERRVIDGKSLRAWIIDTGRTISSLAAEIGHRAPNITHWLDGAQRIPEQWRAVLVDLGWQPPNAQEQ